MRICFDCGIEKKLTDFHKDKSRLLGRTYICRECGNARRRKLSNTPKERLRSKIYQQSDRGKENTRIRQRRDYWVNKHKHIARRMVQALVKTGEIVKMPCEKCGEPKSKGHHPDYARPLEVVWLCQKHHSEEHRKLNSPPLSS